MDPKEKAKEIIKMHLTALAESIPDYFVLLSYAKKCSLVTVDTVLTVRPGCPYAYELGKEVQGLFANMFYPVTYWNEVRREIENYNPIGYIIQYNPTRITCFGCGKTSYSEKDAEYRFCVECDKFHL